MMNLTINQPNDRIEQVNSALIQKLYKIATSAEEDSESNISLKGRLHSNSGFGFQVDYLNKKFSPDFRIDVDSRYIQFEDDTVEQLLINAGIGDSLGISEDDAASAEIGNVFKGNTTITSFKEMPYFTKLNKNPQNVAYFQDCTNLTDVDLSSVEYLTTNEFDGTALSGEISLPSLRGFTGISEYIFRYTNITKIIDLGTISELMRGFCSKCSNLSEVTLPSTCTKIGARAFEECINLTKINGIKSTTVVDDMAFYNADLRDNNFSELINIISTGQDSFRGVMMGGEIYMPKLITLGLYCFNRSPNITKVKSLGKVSDITNSCFNSCYGLSEVYLPYECATIGEHAFVDCSNLTTVKQYTSSVDDWIEGEEPAYTGLYKIITFKNNCFEKCKSLQLDVSELSNSVTIGNASFLRCPITGTLNLPNLTRIGAGAFCETKISSIENLGTITELPGWYGYANMFGTSLTSIKLPSTLTKIGTRVFNGNTNLVNINGFQLNQLTEMEGCFYGCSSLNFGVQYAPSWTTGKNFGTDGFTECMFEQFYLPNLISGNDGSFNRNQQTRSSLFGSSGVTYNTKYQVLYFKKLQYCYPGEFDRLTANAIVINNTTPPVFRNRYGVSDEEAMSENNPDDWTKDRSFNHWDTSNKIYVPDSAVDTYKEAPIWNKVASYIYPMSELTQYATKEDWENARKPVGLIQEYMN